MNWKKLAQILYPLLVGALLSVLCYEMRNHDALAGTIRRAELSPERPLVIRLASGRTTAISFAIRPEKVVPGNPQALEINFLGHDLTIRPLGDHPGNLIVYTKSDRYVILLQMGSEASYDDVVNVTGISGRSRSLRLDEDTYTIEQVQVETGETKNKTTLAAEFRHGGRTLLSQELPIDLRCKGCVVRSREGSTEIACSQEISTLKCTRSKAPIVITRARP